MNDDRPDAAAAASRDAPPPDWRTIQHRVRNDLHTLNALWRLAQRRVPSDQLVEAFPSWLAALSAVYDSVSLWLSEDRLPVKDLLSSIRARCDLGPDLQVEYEAESCLPVQMALVGALALQGLLSYAVGSSIPGTPVRVTIGGDGTRTRVEVAYTAQEQAPAWPPLTLSLAAEAARAEYATGVEDGETVAVLVIPCR